MIPNYRATFTNEPRNVALARNAIASFAQLCGFDNDAVGDIRLAAGEALSNASEYGRGQRNGGFSVSCTFSDETLRIEIQDSGEGFDVPEEVKASVEPDERNRGFGIFIMRRLMDQVEYARNGTRVKLCRMLDGPDGAPGAQRRSYYEEG